jgi:IS30 family transposase
MEYLQIEITKVIDVYKSTISRELRRNRSLRGYRPKQAHHLAMSRRSNSKPRIDSATWALIESLIRQDLSPELVSCWLKKIRDIYISHEWIYQVHPGRQECRSR